MTPQIFTNGRRATLAGSSGCGAGRDERAGRGGRIRRPHQRLADERAIEPERPPAGDGRGLADARFGDDEAVVGHERAQSVGPVDVDLERAQVAVVEPDEAGAAWPGRASSSRSSWASTSGSSPISSARSTSRASRLRRMQDREQQDEVGAGRAQHRELDRPRRRTPWPGPGWRRRRGPPAGRRPSRRTSAARTGPRSPPRRRPRRPGRAPTMSSSAAAIRPADGDERLISAIRCRPGRGEALGDRPRRGRRQAASMSGPGPAATSARMSARRRAAISSTTLVRAVRLRAGRSATVMPVPARSRRRRASASAAAALGRPPLLAQRLEQLGRQPRVDGQRRPLDALLELLDGTADQERGRRR